MVGFLRDLTIEEDLNQQPSKLKNSDDGHEPLPLDLSVPELEDFSLSFVDSFLDFDSIKDWIEENPVLDMDDIKPDSEKVDSVKMEVGAVEGCMGIDIDRSCKETTFGDGFQKLGNLGSSIEEGIGNVSLVGGLDGLVVADANGPKSPGIVGADGICVTGGPPESLNGNGMKTVEILGVNENGVKSGEIMSVAIDGDGPKSDGTESGGDKSDSTSDSDSASSSPSSSSSSSEEEEEEEDDDDEEEEEEEGTEEQEKGKGEELELELEGEIDMEEGEIRDSDVEQMLAWSGNEDDEEDGGDGCVTKGPIRSKNELQVLPPVPPVNVTLQPYHQTLPVGVILSIIGAQVVVEGIEKHNPLNEGSILWITESRSPLGLVDEIFGPVKNPYYIIRYNSENEVPAGVKQGTPISFVPEFANHVLNDRSLYKKGYDASGENDEEMSDEVEFSDDEKEAEYKRMLKMTKRGTNDPKVGNQKNDRKKFKNRGGAWKNSQPPTPQTQEGVRQLSTNHNQHCIPPQSVSLDHGSSSHSFGTDQGFAGSPGLVPPFPQLVQAPGFLPPSSGVWTNGMPCQQQQGMVFPSAGPTNGMPWLQQNNPQQYYQMPLMNRMPFQQQFVPSQGLPSNVALPGAQSNFSAGPAFAPWPGCFGQNSFNQPYGMGFQSQQAPMSMNVGEQLRPPIPGSVEVPQKFNQGTYRGHGRKPYNRGGGRFGGGRGRQQSK